MIYLEAQSSIANSPLMDELKDGAASVGAESPGDTLGKTPTGSGSRGNKKRRGK